MAVSYTKESIDNLKDHVNIVDVIGRAVPLKRAGANFKGLCPFHQEKTPSFSVSESRQYFTCFGCGKKGDVITFVQEYYNLDFQEAVEKLANEYGIKLESRGYNRDSGLERYYEINRMAAQYFYRAFTSGPNPGYSYMEGRQIAPRTLKKFGIGYADDRWDSLVNYLRSRDVDDKTMVEIGLASRGRNGRIFDKFRSRVMFPIINTRGKVIGFGGRALSSDVPAKYLNSPESKIFHKNDNLYALNLTRTDAGREGFIILVEGYMDVIGLYQAGVQNVAASLGTSLTENQAKMIRRYTKDVVLSYDADNAGRKAALRGIEILHRQDCRVRVLHVDDGKDPDEYVKIHGKDGFLKLIDGALPYADYKLDAVRRAHDLNSEAGLRSYALDAAGMIPTLDPFDQERAKKIVCEETRISPVTMERMIEDAAKGRRPEREDRMAAREENRRTHLSMFQKTLIRLFLTDARFLDRLEKFEDEILTDPLTRKLYEEAKNAEAAGRKPDLNLIEDGLLPEDRKAYEEAMAVPIDPEHREDVFLECLRKARMEKARKDMADLIAELSMAEDAADENTVRRITEKIQQLQKKQRELKRGH